MDVPPNTMIEICLPPPPPLPSAEQQVASVEADSAVKYSDSRSSRNAELEELRKRHSVKSSRDVLDFSEADPLSASTFSYDQWQNRQRDLAKQSRKQHAAARNLLHNYRGNKDTTSGQPTAAALAAASRPKVERSVSMKSPDARASDPNKPRWNDLKDLESGFVGAVKKRYLDEKNMSCPIKVPNIPFMPPPVTAKKGTYPDMLRLPSPTKDLEGKSDIPDFNSCEKPGKNGAITGRKYMLEKNVLDGAAPSLPDEKEEIVNILDGNDIASDTNKPIADANDLERGVVDAMKAAFSTPPRSTSSSLSSKASHPNTPVNDMKDLESGVVDTMKLTFTTSPRSRTSSLSGKESHPNTPINNMKDLESGAVNATKATCSIPPRSTSSSLSSKASHPNVPINDVKDLESGVVDTLKLAFSTPPRSRTSSLSGKASHPNTPTNNLKDLESGTVYATKATFPTLPISRSSSFSSKAFHPNTPINHTKDLETGFVDAIKLAFSTPPGSSPSSLPGKASHPNTPIKNIKDLESGVVDMIKAKYSTPPISRSSSLSDKGTDPNTPINYINDLISVTADMTDAKFSTPPKSKSSLTLGRTSDRNIPITDMKDLETGFVHAIKVKYSTPPRSGSSSLSGAHIISSPASGNSSYRNAPMTDLNDVEIGVVETMKAQFVTPPRSRSSSLSRTRSGSSSFSGNSGKGIVNAIKENFSYSPGPKRNPRTPDSAEKDWTPDNLPYAPSLLPPRHISVSSTNKTNKSFENISNDSDVKTASTICQNWKRNEEEEISPKFFLDESSSPVPSANIESLCSGNSPLQNLTSQQDLPSVESLTFQGKEDIASFEHSDKSSTDENIFPKAFITTECINSEKKLLMSVGGDDNDDTISIHTVSNDKTSTSDIIHSSQNDQQQTMKSTQATDIVENIKNISGASTQSHAPMVEEELGIISMKESKKKEQTAAASRDESHVVESPINDLINYKSYTNPIMTSNEIANVAVTSSPQKITKEEEDGLPLVGPVGKMINNKGSSKINSHLPIPPEATATSVNAEIRTIQSQENSIFLIPDTQSTASPQSPVKDEKDKKSPSRQITPLPPSPKDKKTKNKSQQQHSQLKTRVITDSRGYFITAPSRSGEKLTVEFSFGLVTKRIEDKCPAHIEKIMMSTASKVTKHTLRKNYPNRVWYDPDFPPIVTGIENDAKYSPPSTRKDTFRYLVRASVTVALKFNDDEFDLAFKNSVKKTVLRSLRHSVAGGGKSRKSTRLKDKSCTLEV